MHVMNRFFDCFKWELLITIKHIKIVNQLAKNN